MFDEGGWNKEDGGEALSQALLHPQRCPAQHCPPAPRGSLQKQRRRLLATLQRLEASSCTEPPQSPGPLSGDSESESDSADRARRKQPRKQRRGLKPRAASSPHIAPGAPSGSGAPQAEPAGRRRRKDCAAEAPGDKAHTPSKEPPSGEPGAATGGPGPVLSRKQWRNKQKNKRRQKNKFKAGVGQDVGQSLGMGQDVGQSLGGGQDVGQGTSALPPSELSGALRARMEERLQSARFRYINQQLYTSSSQEAAWLFQRDPAAFAIYHQGFARQAGLAGGGRFWMRRLQDCDQRQEQGSLVRPGGSEPTCHCVRHGQGAAGRRVCGCHRVLSGADGHQSAGDPGRGQPGAEARGHAEGGRGCQSLCRHPGLCECRDSAGLSDCLQGPGQSVFLHV
ncbi:ribosomal RNA-processing protein 8 isoform X4 [Mauremys mutica]|uniref:ribosomal RNA-processing protein 8 isoform X4 n=1 Tax=Mauremys mutica TaxID=74926 RepID=UPI001D14D16F|nr:ribosomal RNA-processing protein 8 isoform X4 [Mauremys mutica]